MKALTLLIVMAVFGLLVTACSGTGGGSSTAKGGCLNLVQMLR